MVVPKLYDVPVHKSTKSNVIGPTFRRSLLYDFLLWYRGYIVAYLIEEVRHNIRRLVSDPHKSRQRTPTRLACYE